MPAIPISREALDAIQARRRQEREARLMDAPVAQVINTDTVASLGQPDTLEYRGRVYRVPPLSYVDGMECRSLNLRIATLGRSLRLTTKHMAALADQDVSDENEARLQHLLTVYDRDIGAMVGLCERAVRKMKRLVRPIGLWARLTWWYRQPFLQAEDEEISELLGFFSSRRISRPIRHPRARATTNTTAANHPQRSTAQTI